MKIHPLRIPKVGEIWYYNHGDARKWTITKVSYKENIIRYKNINNVNAVENEKYLHIFQQQLKAGLICYENTSKRECKYKNR